MSERQRNFDPFDVFPQLAVEAPLYPENFGMTVPRQEYGERAKEQARRQAAQKKWLAFIEENQIASRDRGKSTIGCFVEKERSDENLTVFTVTPAAIPRGIQAKTYIRLAVKRPLMRPFDLALVLDPQGQPLTPGKVSPREDMVREGIPAEATEFYYCPGAIIITVSARGRISCHVFELEETKGVHHLRVSKLVDVTVAMLRGALSDTKRKKKLLLARLEDAESFVDEIEELFGLVNKKDPLRKKSESEKEWQFRCRAERIQARRRYREDKVVEYAPEDLTPPAEDEEPEETVEETAQAVVDAAFNGNGNPAPAESSAEAPAAPEAAPEPVPPVVPTPKEPIKKAAKKRAKKAPKKAVAEGATTAN